MNQVTVYSELQKLKYELEERELKVETMNNSAVGNMYRCQALDGWAWMHEEAFVDKARTFLSRVL